MTQLSKSDLKLISNVCGNQFKQRYEGIVKRDSDNLVKVVNTGMVSSGKSSLFNILTDCTDKEKFPTGAARTTTMADYYNYKNISFIDTPGIDVRSEDDELAFRTIMEADLIIMVHNIKTGPINRSEAEWIEKIVAGMNSTDMCKKRMIFVCTWKDTRERDEDYSDIIEDVKCKVFELIGTEIPFFDISSKKYKDGISKGKNVLIERSGILNLKQYLEDYATNYLDIKKDMNRQEMNTLMREIHEVLLNTKTDKYALMAEIQSRVDEKYQSRKRAWSQVYNYFSSMRNQLATLEEEYQKLENPFSNLWESLGQALKK